MDSNYDNFEIPDIYEGQAVENEVDMYLASQEYQAEENTYEENELFFSFQDENDQNVVHYQATDTPQTNTITLSQEQGTRMVSVKHIKLHSFSSKMTI